MFFKMLSKNVSDVLIDTWWNVNQSTSINVDEKIFRFNRYMVECECVRC